MSIPRETSPWPIFVLSHFKSFSVSNPLIGENHSFEDVLSAHSFSPQHARIINNWNAIHECEDECDADRPKKRDAETKESKAMTAAIFLDIPAHESDEATSNLPSYVKDFYNQQFLSILQQSKWLMFVSSLSSVSGTDIQLDSTTNNDTQHSADILNILNLHSISSNLMKKWQNEIKVQENLICNQRRNEPTSENQTMTNIVIKETESLSPLSVTDTATTSIIEKNAPHINNYLAGNTLEANSAKIIKQVRDLPIK